MNDDTKRSPMKILQFMLVTLAFLAGFWQQHESFLRMINRPDLWITPVQWSRLDNGVMATVARFCCEPVTLMNLGIILPSWATVSILLAVCSKKWRSKLGIVTGVLLCLLGSRFYNDSYPTWFCGTTVIDLQGYDQATLPATMGLLVGWLLVAIVCRSTVAATGVTSALLLILIRLVCSISCFGMRASSLELLLLSAAFLAMALRRLNACRLKRPVVLAAGMFYGALAGLASMAYFTFRLAKWQPDVSIEVVADPFYYVVRVIMIGVVVAITCLIGIAILRNRQRLKVLRSWWEVILVVMAFLATTGTVTFPGLLASVFVLPMVGLLSLVCALWTPAEIDLLIREDELSENGL